MAGTGAQRTANVTWKGSLAEGSGTINSTGSGAFGNLGVTWKSRTEESGGLTSPEELIAAAHASCFSMALSHALATGGNAPEQLDVTATATFSREGGPHIESMVLDVRGKVPGMDQAAFQQAAQGAGEGCPVSKALKGNVAITVNARLA